MNNGSSEMVFMTLYILPYRICNIEFQYVIIRRQILKQMVKGGKWWWWLFVGGQDQLKLSKKNYNKRFKFEKPTYQQRKIYKKNKKDDKGGKWRSTQS